jgi:hypothetical protein
MNALMMAFDCPRSHVQAALAYGLDDPGQRGKHITVDQVHEQQIIDWIRQNAEEDTPVTRVEIMDYCAAQFKIKFTRGCVNSFVLRHSGELLQIKVPDKKGSPYKYRERFSMEQIRICTTTYRAV